MANDNRYLLTVGKVLLQVVCKALSGHANGVNVHAVAARTHYATKAARAKLKVLIEALYQVSLVFLVKHFFHGFLCVRVKNRCEPLLGLGFTQSNQFRVIFHTIN